MARSSRRWFRHAQKLKTSGRTLAEVAAGSLLTDLDQTWGKGFMQPKDFLTLVYNTL